MSQEQGQVRMLPVSEKQNETSEGRKQEKPKTHNINKPAT
jgi:hypothetical protein